MKLRDLFVRFAILVAISVIGQSARANKLYCADSFGAASKSKKTIDRGLPDAGPHDLIDSDFRTPSVRTMFGLRERAAKSGAAVIADANEAELLSSILKRTIVPGDTLSLQTIDDEVMLRAFKRLAYQKAAATKKLYPHAEQDDLVQAALLGLMKAVRTQGTSGVESFSNHASRAITDEISEALRFSYPGEAFNEAASAVYERSQILRVKHRFESVTKQPATVPYIQQNYQSVYGRRPTDAEIELALAEDAKGVSNVVRPDPNARAIDSSKLRDSKPLLDEALHMQQRQAVVAQAMLKRFSPNEMTAFTSWSGIEPVKVGDRYVLVQLTDGDTSRETRKTLPVTEARINQLIQKAKQKLREEVLKNRHLFESDELGLGQPYEAFNRQQAEREAKEKAELRRIVLGY